MLYCFLLKNKTMLINELSKRTGLSIHTIRYYENLGMIKGLTDEKVVSNNYKHYDANTIERLEIIIEAREVGFTLAEIKKILTSWFETIDSKPETLELFQAKIKEIDDKMKYFKQTKSLLEKVCEKIQSNND
jgi:DNA-binding transcriptional MerR regulator